MDYTLPLCCHAPMLARNGHLCVANAGVPPDRCRDPLPEYFQDRSCEFRDIVPHGGMLV